MYTCSSNCYKQTNNIKDEVELVLGIEYNILHTFSYVAFGEMWIYRTYKSTQRKK